MLAITIDRKLEDAVYAQIADQIRTLIACGRLKPATALPSVRQLAGNLGVNLNTVARAYRLLESQGFLVIRGRAGVVVAAPAGQIDRELRARLLDQMRETMARLRQAGMAVAEISAVLQHEISAMECADKESRHG